MKTAIVISLILVLLPLTGQAAELFFEPRAQETGIGQEFQVDLMLDPQGEEINAVSASIVFPQDLLEVVGIRNGSSILTLWVEKPSAKNDSVSFSGVIPGGFIGILRPAFEANPGKVIGLTLKTKSEGQGKVVVENAQVLLHDGLGTPASLETSNFEFRISQQIPITEIPISKTDTTPPESFAPEIASDPNVFDGKWFLVFQTQDKNSGIDYYEVQETRSKKQGTRWHKAESPHLLKDQRLKSYIYVKAVDRAGNERIEMLEPTYPMRWYDIWWVWVIIIAVIYSVWRIRKNL